MFGFSKFLLVGVAATSVQYIVFAMILMINDQALIAASSIGYFSGSVVSYFLNYKFTFSSERKHLKALPLFYAMVVMGFFANVAILSLLIGTMLDVWSSQLLTTMSIFFLNYVVSKYVVFKRYI